MRLIRFFFSLISLFLCFCNVNAATANDFLSPEQAFNYRLLQKTPDYIEFEYVIAPGYYLYKNQFKAQAVDQHVRLGELELPKGVVKFDPTFGEDLETYTNAVRVKLPYQVNAPKPFTVTLTSQGCAEAGLCYPPQKVVIDVDPTLTSSTASESVSGVSNWWSLLTSENDYSIAEGLEKQNLWVLLLLFFAMGVLLSFTPCVLPMIPILSSIIVGQGTQVTRIRGVLLAFWYVLGTALVYTVLGVIAGITGASLLIYLQQPIVLLAFAGVLMVLALAMFDVYQLQVPAILQNKLNTTSGSLQGGQALRVFAMGVLSALIAGPCVAAPLAGALVYISKTGNAVLGGAALFSMAWGMGLPLLLVGLSAGQFLPKAGPWMVTVKHIFGVLLLGVAWWMILPLLTVPSQLFGWAVLAIMFVAVLGGLDLGREVLSFMRIVKYALAVLMMMMALVAFLGAVSGARDPLNPLESFMRPVTSVTESQSSVVFEKVSSSQELDALLANAQKPVMLDFYADWCVSCKEMERYTFADASVQQGLSQMRLIQVDVTQNTADHQALLKRFDLFGPPGIIFFDAQGKEKQEVRVVGFQNATKFSQTLGKVLGN